MANPNLDRRLIDLAYKLRDPVGTDPTADGKVFSYEQRAKYLTRAYGALKRKLKAIMSGVEDIFPDFYEIIEVLNSDSSATLNTWEISLSEILSPSGAADPDYVFEIYDMYGSIKVGADTSYAWKQISKCYAENYFSTLFGKSSFYKANDTNLKYFWSIINKKIVFAGGTAEVEKVKLFLKNSVGQFVSTGDDDLIVPTDYVDLLLTQAAFEAMLDLGTDKALKKAQFYNAEIAKELRLLALKEQMKDKTETDKKTDK